MLVIYKDCTDLQGQQSMKFRESWLKLLCGGGGAVYRKKRANATCVQHSKMFKLI